MIDENELILTSCCCKVVRENGPEEECAGMYTLRRARGKWGLLVAHQYLLETLLM